MSKNNKKPKLKHDVSNDFYTLGNVDIKYSGIPNICFSLTRKEDDREKEFIKQRIERGFDDSETWSLRDTIANFIIPRLERYIEIVKDKIKQTDEEKEQINSFLTAMKLIARENGALILTDKEKQELEDGLQNFSKIFLGLWW